MLDGRSNRLADEAISALDVFTQAEILSLVDHRQEEFGPSLPFISNDMSVIRQICGRVAVMYVGEINIENVRENVAASGTEPTSAEVQPEVRREFDISGTAVDPDFERTLSEALNLLIAEDEELAGRVLSDAITTPCAETVPERTVHGTDG